MTAALPGELEGFFDVRTPEAWLDAACARIPELLLDHANCELKAASTALGFIYRYPENTALCTRMSTLAREELRHFEQVRRLMQETSVTFVRLGASRYAGALRAEVRQAEPLRLLDLLLVGALIEARSCERFAALVPRLQPPLAGLYAGLLASEARHFGHYLAFARELTGIGGADFDERLAALKAAEAALVTTPDPVFRFLSGPPAAG